MKLQRRGMQINLAQTGLAVVALAFLASLAFAAPAPTDLAPQSRQDRDRDRDRGPRLLTAEEISLIQVYEVHLDTDPPPRVVISRDDLREFLEEFKEDDRIPRGKEDQEAFLRADGHKQLALLFKVRARDYYEKVQVRSQIESLRDWRAQHRRYVLGYFREHFGKGNVRGLYLFGQGRESERIEMTNFFLLSRISIDGKRLIDRNNPSESLLLQWGLPREDAKFAAPNVDGWRPYFRGTDDKRYKEMEDWIKSLIRANHDTDYGIKYPLPGDGREREDERERPAPAANN